MDPKLDETSSNDENQEGNDIVVPDSVNAALIVELPDCVKETAPEQKQSSRDIANKGEDWRHKNGKTIPPCYFCSHGHWANECDQYTTNQARTNRLKDLKCCIRCGRLGHSASNCYRTAKCLGCDGTHMLALCRKQEIPQQPKFKLEKAGGEVKKRKRWQNKKKTPAKGTNAIAGRDEAHRMNGISSQAKYSNFKRKYKNEIGSSNSANLCSTNLVKIGTSPLEESIEQEQKKLGMKYPLLMEKFAQQDKQLQQNHHQIIQLKAQVMEMCSTIEQEKQEKINAFIKWQEQTTANARLEELKAMVKGTSKEQKVKINKISALQPFLGPCASFHSLPSIVILANAATIPRDFWVGLHPPKSNAPLPLLSSHHFLSRTLASNRLPIVPLTLTLRSPLGSDWRSPVLPYD
jgi:hypothetical protein